MSVYKRKLVSRFGLMHMLATNLCVWTSVVILETAHEMHSGHGDTHHDLHGQDHGGHDSHGETKQECSHWLESQKRVE
jgi:hypothetical protein